MGTATALASTQTRRPEYPLYSPFFGGRRTFTEIDLRVLANTFDFVHGQTLSGEQMQRAHRFHAGVRFIRYAGSWTAGAETAEPRLRRHSGRVPGSCLSRSWQPARTW